MKIRFNLKLSMSLVVLITTVSCATSKPKFKENTCLSSKNGRKFIFIDKVKNNTYELYACPNLDGECMTRKYNSEEKPQNLYENYFQISGSVCETWLENGKVPKEKETPRYGE